jgi:hypothetical protein
VALSLAALSIRKLALVDHRRVSRRTQQREGFDQEDVGMLRTAAIAHACHRINPQLDVETFETRKPGMTYLGQLVVVSPAGAAMLPKLRDCPEGGVICTIKCRTSGVICRISRRLGSAPRQAVTEPDRHDLQISPEVGMLAAGIAVVELLRFWREYKDSSKIVVNWVKLTWSVTNEA